MKLSKMIVLVGSLFLITATVWPQAEDEIPVEVVRLSDRVLVLREDVMADNITAIASKKGLIVVDTSGFPSTARKMREIIEKEFNRSDFAFVINTHWHWDHAWGNQAFPGATIIGHEGCPAMMDTDKEYVGARVQNMKQRLQEQKTKLGQCDPNSEEAQNIRHSIKQMERDIKDHSEGFVITPPQVTFNDRMTWDLGDLFPSPGTSMTAWPKPMPSKERRNWRSGIMSVRSNSTRITRTPRIG